MSDAEALAEIISRMDTFETLVVDDGNIYLERAYKAATLAEALSRIVERRAGERLTVHRFPDGYKLTLTRRLFV